MPEVVFDDTPLADYLSDAGIGDWGIEEDAVDSPASLTSGPLSSSLQPGSGAIDGRPVTQRAVSGARQHYNWPNGAGSHTPEDTLIPLNLSAHSSHIRRCRFFSYVRMAVDPRLSPQETARFLEQFRYAMVSSQLLESRPLYATCSRPQDERLRDVLFSNSGPWDMLKLPAKYWVGGGGWVVAIAAVFGNRIRAQTKSNLGSLPELYSDIEQKHSTPQDNTVPPALIPKSRSVHGVADADTSTDPAISAVLKGMALIMTLCVGLYLYAHSRRRLLRLLHAKSLGQISLFVDVNRRFDGDCVRALKSLTQSEMMVLGNHPNYTGRVEDPASPAVTRAGKTLRAVMSSSLYLGIEAYLDAIKDCVGMCSELDLQRYFEVYDIPTTQQELHFVMNDSFVGFVDESGSEERDFLGPAACYTPLPVLKNQFRKLHFLRRALMCCLLSVNSEGQASATELESWTVIADHLKICTDIAQDMSRMLTKDRFDPGHEDTQQRPVATKRPQPDLVDLNILAQHVAARVDLVSNTELSSAELDHHKALLQNDIAMFNNLWARISPAARENEARSLSRQSRPARWSAISVVSGDSSLTLREDDLNFSTPDITADISHQDTLVLETVVPDRSIKPRSTLTREERICLNKAREAEQALAQSQVPSSDLFMKELNSVLARRTDTDRRRS